MKKNKTYVDAKEFTIKRSKWRRGTSGDKGTMLLNKEGKMCCLGFYARACGFKKKDISNRCSPESLSETLDNKDSVWNSFLLSDTDNDSFECEQLMMANDDEDYVDDYREERIKQLFKRQNIKVNFID